MLAMNQTVLENTKNSTDDLNTSKNKKMSLPAEWMEHFKTLSESTLGKEQEEILKIYKSPEKTNTSLMTQIKLHVLPKKNYLMQQKKLNQRKLYIVTKLAMK